MTLLRLEFHARLQNLEDQMLATGRQVQARVIPSVRALLDADRQAAQRIVDADDVTDQELRWADDLTLELINFQGPVADELRLLMAAHRLSRHIERIGDYGVNIARLAGRLPGDGDSPALTDQIMELAILAEQAVGLGLDAFGHRAPDGLERVHQVEQLINRLTDGLTDRLTDHAVGGAPQTRWVIGMTRVVTYLERTGDRATSMAELGAWIPTGTRRPLRADR